MKKPEGYLPVTLPAFDKSYSVTDNELWAEHVQNCKARFARIAAEINGGPESEWWKPGDRYDCLHYDYYCRIIYVFSAKDILPVVKFKPLPESAPGEENMDAHFEDEWINEIADRMGGIDNLITAVTEAV